MKTTGNPIGDLKVTRRARVWYFTAENPLDISRRTTAMLARRGKLRPERGWLTVFEHAFSIKENLQILESHTETNAPDVIFVDTHTTFREAEDHNSNAEAKVDLLPGSDPVGREWENRVGMGLAG